MFKFDEADRKRRALATARNELESFVYKTKEFLTNEEVKKVAKAEDLELFLQKLIENGDWLYGEGEVADVKELKARLTSLEQLRDPIESRKSELQARPNGIKALEKQIDSLEETIAGLMKNYTREAESDLYEDIDSSSKVLNTTRDWLKETLEKQDSLNLYDNPVLLSKDLKTKTTELKYKVSLLEMRKRLVEVRIAAEKSSSLKAEKSKSAAAAKAEASAKSNGTEESTDPEGPVNTTETVTAEPSAEPSSEAENIANSEPTSSTEGEEPTLTFEFPQHSEL
jgi:hypoxia up-regulated 1